MVTIRVTAAQDAATVLAGLSSARTPWFTLALAGPADRGRLAAAAAGDVTVVDITDPQAVPVMVNPFEPASGYPVQAHVDRLAGLFEATFGLSEPVAGALRAGLRRAYADCGWDMRTGAARPGAVISPATPAFRQLKLAAEDAARNLGYDTGMRAAVRGFLETRLDALWAGPAGLFLEGGHPAGLDRLLRGNVLVTSGGLADEEARLFLAGALLLRLAGQPAHRAGRSRAVVVIAVPGAASRADEPAQAWLRLWVRTLVLSFLTGRPVPGVPAPLRSAGQLHSAGQLRGPARGPSGSSRSCAGCTRWNGSPRSAATASGPATSRRRSTSAWPGCPTGRGSGSRTGWTACADTRWRWGRNATAGSP
jgi:hypothetical protein